MCSIPAISALRIPTPPSGMTPMHYSVSHQKLKLLLSAQGLSTGDAGGIDQLFGGKDGYYWNDQYEMVKAIQDHENATAAEDEMKPQVPSPANIAALSKLLANPI
jgi:hypothetical protein